MQPTNTTFLGLAPFLRMSIAGIDLLPSGQEMLKQTENNPDDANLWMNLSTAMLCLGQRDLGLAIQEQALALNRVYVLPASQQPAKLRILMLSVPGDLAANTPLDCLLEDSEIDLIFYYLSADNLFPAPIPEHDVLMVGISESDENQNLLASLESALSAWPRPIINAPQHIPKTARTLASKLLRDIPGLLMPTTVRAHRDTLRAVATGKHTLSDHFNDCDFPIILRPVGSHAGRDLSKLDGPEEISDYLSKLQDEEFYLSRFIDYSAQDGLFRKMRIALIDGTPYACHMAVSTNWMIHYVNAGMYDESDKREEEAAFMNNFNDFVHRHQTALEAIYQLTKLDYFCIDCAETQDGRLFVFEIDHAMVVHAMDPEQMFPYKQQHIQKARDAFQNFVLRLAAK